MYIYFGKISDPYEGLKLEFIQHSATAIINSNIFHLYNTNKYLSLKRKKNYHYNVLCTYDNKTPNPILLTNTVNLY